ncbi:30S ribosomal protein S17 [Candidatus Woesearchaeota archaeon]|nr:30S ribosomal protein S17 [Candidatus Woesearchaeota archaeon]
MDAEKKEAEKGGDGCTDTNCPFHGSLRTHGRVFIGMVISSKMHKTVTVQWERKHYLPKYERYERRRTTLKAHNPPCLNAAEGEIVRLKETRALSKTKHFVVVEKLGKVAHMQKTERSEAKPPVAREGTGK